MHAVFPFDTVGIVCTVYCVRVCMCTRNMNLKSGMNLYIFCEFNHSHTQKLMIKLCATLTSFGNNVNECVLVYNSSMDYTFLLISLLDIRWF